MPRKSTALISKNVISLFSFDEMKLRALFYEVNYTYLAKLKIKYLMNEKKLFSNLIV